MSLNVTSRNVSLLKEYEGNFSLDAGCGKGFYLGYFKHSVVGLDISRKRIKFAKSKSSPRAFFVVGDIRFLPFKSKVFDYLFAAEAIEHLNEHEIDSAISEFERVTNGTVHISTPNCNFLQELLRKITFASLFDKEHMSEMEADDPHKHKSSLTEKTLEQYGFQVNGCLGWVTAQIINIGFVSRCYDLLVWRYPHLAGSLIATKNHQSTGSST
jgi:ubiquinone/menaquinone biosynthesis C-methylase UbiE